MLFEQLGDLGFERGRDINGITVGVLVILRACEWPVGMHCYTRAKEEYVRLLGENSAKAIEAALAIVSQLHNNAARVKEYKRLWEIAKDSLPNEVATYDIAHGLEVEFRAQSLV